MARHRDGAALGAAGVRTVSVEDVRVRLDAWRRSGNSDDLWPDSTARERLAALGRIRTVVAAVLARGERPRLTAADATEAGCLGVAAFTAGLGPLLGWWIEHGDIDAAPDVTELLGTHLRHGERRIALLRGHVAAVVRAMRDVGVDPILLKGMHTGAEFFPHPSTRPAADVDFLVRPTEMERAAGVLSSAGFTEIERTSFANRSTWAHSTACRVVHSLEMDVIENPWTIDLHRTLERWYFRGTRRDVGAAAFDTTRRVEIDGESIRVLDQPHLTAFLALHASSHLRTMQMVRLLELVWVVRTDRRTGRLDLRALGDLLRRTDTGRFAYPALALAEDLAPGTFDPSLLDDAGRNVSARLRRVIDKIRRAELGALNERSLDALLAWATGPREVVLNALDLLLPSDDGLGTLPAAVKRRVRIVIAAASRKVADGGREDGDA
jgi:hypothetical protein